MKFLVDAQLPKKLALMFQYRGYDAIHTLDLPAKNFTKDSEINRISIREQRILITKDRDFIESFIVSNKPYKLLYVNTGNVTTTELIALFSEVFSMILEAFETSRMIELTQTQMIVHQQ